jgi:ATP-binding cassette subfamily B multidrug efflux pump
VDQLGSGALVTRMSSDCDQLSRSVNSALRIGVKAPALCVGSVVYAMGLDMGLSWIVLAVVLGVTALITAYLAESGRRFRRVREAMDRVNTTVEEFLRGIRLIRALGREEWENRRFQASNGELEESGIRLQLLSAWFAPLVTLTVNLGIAAVLWAAGCGGAEAGTVSALVTYMTQMLTSLMTLIDVFKLLIRARTSVRRVEEVLALPEEGTLEGPEETGVEEPVLELRHVTFAYPGGSGVPALQDISFTLRRGERLAVVGPTGAGKTTLAWLCARLYEPQKGELYLGGRPMSRLPLVRVRRQVVVAAQRSALFSGTIRENLSMGDRGAGEAQLCAALETAQAADFVAEAGGLDAVLVQGGVNLSGGQRQRLSLARALVRGGAVLVLDDCTSALDPATERRVLDGLERRPGQAVLHITQKVRAARTADRILVLEEGRQVGLGTHRSLLDTCPTYREIWASQAPEEEGEDGTR